MVKKRLPVTASITRLEYQPGGGYSFDLEIFSVENLRSRFGRVQMSIPHRYAFGMLLLVTDGRCTQLVDFKEIECCAGSLLVLTPGQAHRFGDDDKWNGWVVLFKAEFLFSPGTHISRPSDTPSHESVSNISGHFSLESESCKTIADALLRMKRDTELEANRSDINALLYHQFTTILMRLQILQGGKPHQQDATTTKRFNDFKLLVEQHYHHWHSLTHYANQLSCTEKSLSRATQSAAGITAKAFVTARIILEAKRLLVHSATSIASIAVQLGFNETTNFVKFFRRNANTTPGEFRQRMGKPDSSQ
jgi:AraC-like DNA-binding protein